MTTEEKHTFICKHKDKLQDILEFILNSIPVKLPLYRWVIVPTIMFAINKFFKNYCNEQEK